MRGGPATAVNFAGRRASFGPPGFPLLGTCENGRRRAGDAGNFLGPYALTASKDGRTLYVANADARQIAFVDTPSGKVTRSIGMPAEASGLVLSPDGRRLYVTCAAARSTVFAIDAASGEVTATIAAGHTAVGPGGIAGTGYGFLLTASGRTARVPTWHG